MTLSFDHVKFAAVRALLLFLGLYLKWSVTFLQFANVLSNALFHRKRAMVLRRLCVRQSMCSKERSKAAAVVFRELPVVMVCDDFMFIVPVLS